MQFARRTCAALAVSYVVSGVHGSTLRGKTVNGTDDALSAAMSVIKTISEKGHVPSAASTPTVSIGSSAAAQHPKKIDVGFQGFEKNLTTLVEADIRGATTDKPWNASMQDALVANVTASLSAGLHQMFLPLKKTIGKTWMALPRDDQKDAYIGQLKASFANAFSSSLSTIENHVQIGLRHFKALAKRGTLSPAELLQKSEAGVADSLLGEHCYADGPKKISKGTALLQATQEAEAAMLIQEAIGEAFCIQPVVGGLVHHLNDTMELITMTMRFDAGAMSLAQQKKMPKAH